MTGWNLPPGCRVSDIPGNTAEDLEAEAFVDAFDAILQDCRIKLPDDKFERLVEAMHNLVARAYQHGYQEAQADEAQYQAWRYDEEQGLDK